MIDWFREPQIGDKESFWICAKRGCKVRWMWGDFLDLVRWYVSEVVQFIRIKIYKNNFDDFWIDNLMILVQKLGLIIEEFLDLVPLEIFSLVIFSSISSFILYWLSKFESKPFKSSIRHLQKLKKNCSTCKNSFTPKIIFKKSSSPRRTRRTSYKRKKSAKIRKKNSLSSSQHPKKSWNSIFFPSLHHHNHLHSYVVHKYLRIIIGNKNYTQKKFVKKERNYCMCIKVNLIFPISERSTKKKKKENYVKSNAKGLWLIIFFLLYIHSKKMNSYFFHSRSIDTQQKK